MSKKFGFFTNGNPPVGTDNVLLSRTDGGSPSGKSNYIVSMAQLAAFFASALTTANVPDSLNRRYVTDAQLVVIGNTSGTNTGDQVNIPGNAATVTTNANLTGPITSVGNATAITNGVVTYAKIQNVTDARLLGNSSGGAGAPMEISVAGTLTLAAGVLTGTGGSGDVTAAAVMADEAIVRGDGGAKGVQGSNAFIDDNANMVLGNPTRVQIGGLFTPQLQVIGNTTSETSDNAIIGSAAFDSGGSGGKLLFSLAKTATIGGQGLCQLNDFIGQVSAYASDGVQYLDCGDLFFQVDAASGVGSIPTRLDLYLNSGASTPRVLSVKSNGNALFNTGSITDNGGRLQIGPNTDTTNAGGLNFGGDNRMFRVANSHMAMTSMLQVRAPASGTPQTSTADGVNLFAASSNIAAMLCDSSRSADGRKVEMVWGSGNYTHRFINDAYNSSSNILLATGTSAGVTLFTVPVATVSVFGHTASVDLQGVPKLQVMGNASNTAMASISGFANDATTAGLLELSKSRHATTGSNTIVQSGDSLGGVVVLGANGSSYTYAASIVWQVDGTPGASNDMPTRMLVRTTPDGSGTMTEAWRVDSAQKTIFQIDRPLRFNNGTSAAGAAAGTLLNSPTAGDPGHWLKINIAGTNYAIPCWLG